MKLNIDLGKYVITGTKHDLILSEKKKVTDEKSKNYGNEKSLCVAVTTASLNIWLKSYATAKFWRQKRNHFRRYNSISRRLVCH